GKVELERIKVPKGKILTATRKSIDPSFSLATIESITDTGIQKILKNYLLSKGGNSELAFSPEGLEDMNSDIRTYNDGKPHQPIYKARIFETGSKFQLGQSGNKNSKYVEAAKGTNLFFAIYEGTNGKRRYETIPLNVVVERQKQGLSSVPAEADNGDKLLFHLSPNDLVYVPSEDEKETFDNINFSQLETNQLARIYKVVSFSGNQIFFIRHDVAIAIVNKGEFSVKNKMERAIDGTMIKECCIKIRVDRLGEIVGVEKKGKNYQEPSHGKSTVNEPLVARHFPRKITISNSFEESENSQLSYWAGLTPEQRFADFFELMNRFYTFLKPNWKTRKIVISP
ncbi:MAG TPA: hypothetical protein PLV32_06885, partial [Chitinophagaceae bacterium]|nr:hypothetical protein [Chitinophagaceae bacterium]